MANSKGNNFPVWFIAGDQTVYARDAQGVNHPMSPAGFAKDLGISTDGTIWAVSNKPDPDGGGGALFWCNGDGNWNPIESSAPGGIHISGDGGIGLPSSGLYISSDFTLWNVFTDNSGGQLQIPGPLFAFDTGAGYAWAVVPDQESGIPYLNFMNVGGGDVQWTKFGPGLTPTGISVSYNGDCYGILDGNPTFFSKDGVTYNSAGAGADGIGLQMSFKNTIYLVTTNVLDQGNQVMIWVDEQGGVFQDAGFQAAVVLSTYNQ